MLTEPVVDPEPGNPEPNGSVGPAKGVAEVDLDESAEGDAEIAEGDELRVLLLVQGAAGVEVVDAATHAVLLALTASLALALVVVVAGDVGHEVVGPADELLPDEHGQGEDGSLLGQLGHLVQHAADLVGVLLTGARDEDHVALHVAGGLVVLAVGDLPAEVGDEEQRVQEPAGGVVDRARRRESAVTALVGDDPETGTEQALHGRVQTPESEASALARDVLGGDKVVEDVKRGGEASNIAQDVGPAADGRSLEAVLGDGIADVLDGVVRGREVVAVRVDQVVVLRLALGVNVDGGEGRQRGGGGRGTRRVGGRHGSRGLRVVGRSGGGDGPPQDGVAGHGGTRRSCRGSHCGRR